MELILHIGREKTGTTALQAALQRNFTQSSSKFYYPQDVTNWSSFRSLTALFDNSLKYHYYRRLNINNWEQHRLLSRKIEDDIQRQLDITSKTHKCWIISTENMSTNLTELQQIERLKVFLDKHFTLNKIICYFRDQYSDAISRYAQRIKKGDHLNFDIYVNSIETSSPLFNHEKYMDLWASVFDSKLLFAENYIAQDGTQKDIILDFFTKHLKLRVNTQNSSRVKLNEKFNYIACECFSYINKKFPRWGEKDYSNLEQSC